MEMVYDILDFQLMDSLWDIFKKNHESWFLLPLKNKNILLREKKISEKAHSL